MDGVPSAVVLHVPIVEALECVLCIRGSLRVLIKLLVVEVGGYLAVYLVDVNGVESALVALELVLESRNRLVIVVHFVDMGLLESLLENTEDSLALRGNVVEQREEDILHLLLPPPDALAAVFVVVTVSVPVSLLYLPRDEPLTLLADNLAFENGIMLFELKVCFILSVESRLYGIEELCRDEWLVLSWRHDTFPTKLADIERVGEQVIHTALSYLFAYTIP